MNMMRNFSLISILTLFLFSCAGSTEKSEEIQTNSKIILSCNKTIIVQGDEDPFIFDVQDENGENLTSQAKLYANEQPLEGYSFLPQEIGVYNVFAKTEDQTSNLLQLKVIAKTTHATLVVSKTQVTADGGDFIQLKVLSDDQTDITSMSEFYANNDTIEGSKFRTTERGSYVISAKFNNQTISETVRVAASNLTAWTGRTFIEYLTSTDCVNCPETVKGIDDISKNNPKVISMEYHTNKSTVWSSYYSDNTRNLVTNYINTFNTFTGTPTIFLNRENKSLKLSTIGTQGINESIPSDPQVAIAIETEVTSNGEISVIAHVGSKKDQQISVSALLVESEIPLMYIGESKALNTYHLFRDMKPTLIGEVFQAKTNRAISFNTTLSKSYLNIDNCAVIVIANTYENNSVGKVLNAQIVKVGENTSY